MNQSLRKVFALVTEGEHIIMTEAVLCDECFQISANQGYAKEMASQADDWDKGDFHEFWLLLPPECCICGSE